MNLEPKETIALVSAIIALASLAANVVQGFIYYRLNRLSVSASGLKTVLNELAVCLNKKLVFAIGSQDDEIWKHVFTSLETILGHTSVAYIALRHSKYASDHLTMKIGALDAHIRKMLTLRPIYSRHEATVYAKAGKEEHPYVVQGKWSSLDQAEALRKQGMPLANGCQLDITSFIAKLPK